MPMRTRTREPRRRRVLLGAGPGVEAEAGLLQTARAASREQARQGTRCVGVEEAGARRVCDLAVEEGRRVTASCSATMRERGRLQSGPEAEVGHAGACSVAAVPVAQEFLARRTRDERAVGELREQVCVI